MVKADQSLWSLQDITPNVEFLKTKKQLKCNRKFDKIAYGSPEAS